MTFTRTNDMDLVRAIILESYEWTSDDGSPDKENYKPPESDAIWYIVAQDREELLGLWMLHPRNYCEFEVHTCLVPGHGMRRGRQAAKEAMAWVHEHIPQCRRLITWVPSFNKIAYRFALDAGFELMGIDRESFLKRGNLYDQAILGFSFKE